MPHRLIWSTIPILPYADAQKTCDFYEQIGFRLTYAGVDYLTMNRDGVELHFARTGQHMVGHGPASCYVRTPDVDRLRNQLIQVLGDGIGEVCDMPWRMREFHVVDPFGNLMRFAQPSTD